MNREQSLLLIHEFKINTSSELFFKWFSDLSNYRLFFDHIVFIKAKDHSQDPFAEEGKEYLELAKNFFGKEEELNIKVTKLILNESIWIRTDNPRLKHSFKFQLYSINPNKCNLIWKLTTRHQNPIIIQFLRFAVFILFKGRLKKAELNLRKIFP